MELTDKQYKRISGYMDGDMNAAERRAFENDLQTNGELAAELALYKHFQAICESAAGKFKNEVSMADDGMNRSEQDVLNMIVQAKQNWERENRVPADADPMLIKKHPAKLINIQGWAKVAVAAVLLGVIITAGVWWLQQRKPPEQNMAANKQEQNKNTTAVKPIVNPPASLPPKSTDSGTAIEQPLTATNETARPRINTQQLFAANFQPDELPKVKDSVLSEPFEFYVTKNWGAAIEALELYKADYETRGEGMPVSATAFTLHYYLGLSYLAGNAGATKAINELQSALRMTPGGYMESKTLWYLALANLKDANVEETRRLLQKLANDPLALVYQQKAQDLLKKLSG